MWTGRSSRKTAGSSRAAAVGCWITWLFAAATAAAASDLQLRAGVAAPRVFRIDVSEPAPAAEPLPSRVESDGCSLEIAAGGRVTASVGDQAVWFGEIRALAPIGRARLPAVQVSWAATPGEAIYGLGERFDGLNQYGKKVEMWVRDKPGQGRASYVCVPVVYSTGGYALFAADNPQGEFDLNSQHKGQHRYWRAGHSATLYLAVGSSLKDFVQKRAGIVGLPAGAPDWAWGLWMSRNSYENQDEAEQAIRGMAERNIPVSAIVQEAWKGRSESGDFHRFSEPKWPRLPEYFALCAEHDIKTILWQVPVVHPSTPGYADLGKYLVHDTNGAVRLRTEWLEGFANFDFTNPQAARYFKDLLRPLVKQGVRGFKVDDGEDIRSTDLFFDGRRGGQVHNEYPVLFARALHELLEEERADGILWVRSGSVGSEKYPALWAGDQYGTWDQLRSLVPAGLSAGLSGLPLWGHDIGGYIGAPTPELYIRWAQFGAFSPIMQYHGQTPREPWGFGPEAEQAFKFLAHLRMNLRPTLKALGEEAAKTGLPIMRPMILEFPDDARFVHEDTQYMLGPDLLVAPVVQQGAKTRTVKFPKGTWRHLLERMPHEGPSEADVPVDLMTPAVFVRDGATLQVELDKSARLGTWRKGAAVRTIKY